MPQRDIVVPLPGPKHHAKEYLKRYGFVRPFHRLYRGLTFLFLFFVLAFFMAWVTENYFPKLRFHGADAFTAIVALGALVLGYQQWREARHENSMEKYYERLHMANTRQEPEHERVHEMMAPCLPESPENCPRNCSTSMRSSTTWNTWSRSTSSGI